MSHFQCDNFDKPADAQRHHGVYKSRGDFTWEGIEKQEFRPAHSPMVGVTRQMLYGERGEKGAFHARYFEVAPGGNSSHETHRHEHAVIILRGKGLFRNGDKLEPIAPMDMVYVASGVAHQFLNPAENREPLGFICIVDKERDLGMPVATTPA